jgi:hypothetical protein
VTFIIISSYLYARAIFVIIIPVPFLRARECLMRQIAFTELNCVAFKSALESYLQRDG